MNDQDQPPGDSQEAAPLDASAAQLMDRILEQVRPELMPKITKIIDMYWPAQDASIEDVAANILYTAVETIVRKTRQGSES